MIDSYIHVPLQQIVGERLRPEGRGDPFGAEQARGVLRQGYDLVAPMIAGPWAMGETFTLADCAALPALYYADYAVPLAPWPALAAYLERLKARPSVARVLREAEPFLQFFPLARAIAEAPPGLEARADAQRRHPPGRHIAGRASSTRPSAYALFLWAARPKANGTFAGRGVMAWVAEDGSIPMRSPAGDGWWLSVAHSPRASPAEAGRGG